MFNYHKPVIGYLLKTFPKLSETFILNEILELERQGLKLHIFSLRSPTDEQYHPIVAQIKSPITYIPSILPGSDPEANQELSQARLSLLHSEPKSFLRVLERFLERPEEKHLNELWQAVYLAQELKRHNIPYLHVHFANVPAATAELAQEICGIPFSLTAHAKDIYLTEPEALNRRIAKAAFVLTCTDCNRRYLNDLSSSDTPIHLAYHGIDMNTFTPLPMPPCSSPHPIELLSVGRFCEKKGFFYLMKACQLLRNRGVKFHCSIVGYGSLQARMVQWIQEFSLESVVTLVGKLTQDQVVECYRQADIFVLPCVITPEGDRDGIPNVLLEAMAMELPVVSTNVSGINELVETDQNGILVPERDASALANALESLIGNEERRSHLGKAGSQTVHQRFTLSHNVSDVRDHLLWALKKERQTIVHLLMENSSHLTS